MTECSQIKGISKGVNTGQFFEEFVERPLIQTVTNFLMFKFNTTGI